MHEVSNRILFKKQKFMKGGTSMPLGFGRRLRKLRQSAGFTQKQLADSVHVSKGTISNYETEERQPSPMILRDLAKTLHISTDYLLGMEENTQTLDISGLTSEEIQFLHLAIRLITRKRR